MNSKNAEEVEAKFVVQKHNISVPTNSLPNIAFSLRITHMVVVQIFKLVQQI
jgi:hypothetical protein